MKSFLVTILSFVFFSIANAQDNLSIDPPGLTTTIKFDQTEFEYGAVEQGEKIRHVFTFSNTGNEPLIITKAKGSCGCTVPNWPKAPILPGESGEIAVVFDTKGKKGKQAKRVTITANTEPAMTFLTIKGEVLVPDEAIAEKRVDQSANKQEKTKKDHKNCISVYPNPTTDVLKLDIKEHVGKSAIIDIYTDMGQQLEQKTVDKITRDPITFDVRNYTPGMYTVTIRVEGKPLATKCFLVAQN